MVCPVYRADKPREVLCGEAASSALVSPSLTLPGFLSSCFLKSLKVVGELLFPWPVK